MDAGSRSALPLLDELCSLKDVAGFFPPLFFHAKQALSLILFSYIFISGSCFVTVWKDAEVLLASRVHCLRDIFSLCAWGGLPVCTMTKQKVLFEKGLIEISYQPLR